MRDIKAGTNVTIFLVFFGVSLLDAIRFHNWLTASLWFAIGLVFLRADVFRRRS